MEHDKQNTLTIDIIVMERGKGDTSTLTLSIRISSYFPKFDKLNIPFETGGAISFPVTEGDINGTIFR